MNDDFGKLTDKDVLLVENQAQILTNQFMNKVVQSISQVKRVIRDAEQRRISKTEHVEGWFEEGVDCEVLRLGAKSWQKGKVRLKISLEFCPDNPQPEEIEASNETDANLSESSLDDLRQKINQET